jgi:hypothetical protein
LLTFIAGCSIALYLWLSGVESNSLNDELRTSCQLRAHALEMTFNGKVVHAVRISDFNLIQNPMTSFGPRSLDSNSVVGLT